MVFSSIEFLFLFLPTVVVGYYLLPRGVRNGWLLLASLIFYAWGEPSFVLVMLLSIALNFVLALGMACFRERRREGLCRYRGEAAQRNPFRLALYIALFQHFHISHIADGARMV